MKKNKKRVVIKVGTNVLQSNRGKLDYNLIRDLAEQIALISKKGYEVVLVSSGAVGAGNELQPFSKEKDETLRGQMKAAIGQIRLMQTYSDFFFEHQMIIAQVLLTRANFSERSSYLNIRNTLEGLLEAGVLPIINENDVVATDELAPQFGDNDQLAVSVSALIGADALFFLTTAKGVMSGFDASGKSNPELIETVSELTDDILKHCHSSTSSGGKGGMLSKVRSAGMAMAFGTDAYIVAGKDPHVILQILKGEKHGTHFVAHGEKINSYRKWLAAGAHSKGTLTIDKGAEKALQNKKSLLAAGISDVEGEFELKDLVTIQNQDGVRIGVGRISLSSKELKIQILERNQPPKTSGNPAPSNNRKAVISRDHLVLQETSA